MNKLGKKWIWAIISILPIIGVLAYLEAGQNIWFWSVAFFVSGIILAKFIRFLISKIKHPNPPIIIK